MRRQRAVVVTDMREPLAVLHRRLIRRRLVLMVVWICGWAATGFVSDSGWLAIAILVVTGPVLWVAVWLATEHEVVGRREAPTLAITAEPGRTVFDERREPGTSSS